MQQHVLDMFWETPTSMKASSYSYIGQGQAEFGNIVTAPLCSEAMVTAVVAIVPQVGWLVA
jgi:hypothetical protein